MTLKKHIDTSSMVEEFLKKNEVTQCPDYVKGCDKPLIVLLSMMVIINSVMLEVFQG